MQSLSFFPDRTSCLNVCLCQILSITFCKAEIRAGSEYLSELNDIRINHFKFILFSHETTHLWMIMKKQSLKHITLQVEELISFRRTSRQCKEKKKRSIVWIQHSVNALYSTLSLGSRLMVFRGRSTRRTLRDLMVLMSLPLVPLFYKINKLVHTGI